MKKHYREFSWPYEKTPEEWNPYDHDVDYCGPNGKWYSKYLSRYILGIDCNKCYWSHDERYEYGTTEEDRLVADKIMRDDQRACIIASTRRCSLRRHLALAVAYRRYCMVKWFGGAFH